ncbi:MAG TPA: hypothetical protein VEP29_07670, partial [Desulfatiglandales bacterium]|nr:hypothetical protein [Desulfatiglandales bacterium]
EGGWRTGSTPHRNSISISGFVACYSPCHHCESMFSDSLSYFLTPYEKINKANPVFKVSDSCILSFYRITIIGGIVEDPSTKLVDVA